MNDQLRKAVWERKLLAMMAARFYHHLRDRYATEERQLSTAIVICGVLTSLAAGVALQVEWTRWVLMVLGGANALLITLHRHRARSIEANEAARYATFFDDRAAEWGAIWSRHQAEDDGFTWERFELELQRDLRLPLARFAEDADLSAQVYNEVYAELGLKPPTRETRSMA